MLRPGGVLEPAVPLAPGPVAPQVHGFQVRVPAVPVRQRVQEVPQLFQIDRIPVIRVPDGVAVLLHDLTGHTVPLKHPVRDPVPLAIVKHRVRGDAELQFLPQGRPFGDRSVQQLPGKDPFLRLQRGPVGEKGHVI